MVDFTNIYPVQPQDQVLNRLPGLNQSGWVLVPVLAPGSWSQLPDPRLPWQTIAPSVTAAPAFVGSPSPSPAAVIQSPAAVAQLPMAVAVATGTAAVVLPAAADSSTATALNPYSLGYLSCAWTFSLPLIYPCARL